MDTQQAYSQEPEHVADGDAEFDAAGALTAPHDLDAIRQVSTDFTAAFNALLNEAVVSRRQLEEHAGRIAELDGALQQAGGSLRDEAARREQLEQELAAQADNFNRQLQEVSGERASLQQQYAACLETIAGLEQELTGLREEYRKACEAHAQEQASLDQQLGTLNSEHEQLQQVACDREREIGRLNGTLEQNGSELQALGDVYRELEAHVKNLEKLNKALQDSSASEQSQSRKAIAARDRELESLRSRLAEHGDARQDVERFAAEIQELQVKLSTAEQQLCQLADLQCSLRDAEQKLADHAALEEENGRLRAELQAASPAAPSAQQEQQPEIERLQAELAELRCQLEEQAGLQDGRPASPEQDRADGEGLAAMPGEQDAGTTAGQAGPDSGDLPGDHETHTGVVDQGQEVGGYGTFMTTLQGALVPDRKADVMVAAVRIQVDDFVQIREENGVLNSEYLIDSIQNMLAPLCDMQETLARADDHAFAVLLTGADENAVRQRVEDMRAAVENSLFETDSCSVVATVSAGIALIDAGDVAADDVIARAGDACEAARTAGGNRVLVHSAEVPAGGSPAVFGDDANIVSGVLRENRIRAHYQPISNLKGNASGYYEVLVRVADADGNAITPGEFFAMAERSGRSGEVDFRIIETAVKVLAEDKDKGTTLFVKLSAASVEDQELGMRIMKLLKSSKVSPGRLVLEVTENKLKQDLKNVSALTRALHSIGCKVAIEHCTHAVQAQHFKHVHADYLKIDASLVRDAGTDGANEASIRAIIDIARSQGCKTIAEKVESPYSLTWLWGLGVDYAQGFFIQEPGADRGYDFGGTDSGTGSSKGDGKAVFTTD